jgi:two-component system sensor histidine kinase SenX3
MSEPSQLSRSQRPKWHYVAMGVALISVAVALTIAWQILAAPDAVGRGVGTARAVAYFFGSLLFLLLIGGLVLIVILLLREVRLNERQSNFVSAVTHELKTPVASLRLYLDTLEYRELPEGKRKDFYRTMRQDLDRLNGTINNVLDAALYTDHPVQDPRPLDLARLARRAIELTLTRHQLPEGSIRYLGPESLQLAGDPQALETAVLNLLDNAVKYSKEGVRIEVETWGDGDGQAHLLVRDHGMGISRTQLPFIFTRFYRIGSEVRRSRTGTGLGLFIVRSVVKGHRGAITADSPGPGRGSTFTITLPGLIDVDNETEAPEEEAETRG